MDLLASLRGSPDQYISSAELLGVSGLTRAAVWKQIEELRARGYVIEARPRLGYRLISAPDVPYPEEVQAGLLTTVFGRPLIHLPLTGSTNQDAKRLAAEGWPEGTVVTAETQTAGRGRLGRSWISPPGGLLFTMILRPSLPLAELGPLAIVAAVVLARAIKEQTGLDPSIKWPNDLLYGGRKLAGVLAEASGELGRVNFAVLGLGLNVNQNQDDFPEELRERATSLKEILGGEIKRVPLLRRFLTAWEEAYLGGLAKNSRLALEEAAANSATLGRLVNVATGQRIVSGLAKRLDPDGALVIETASGEVRVTAGEIDPSA